MKEERYLSAEEALALGFTDRVIYSTPERFKSFEGHFSGHKGGD